MDAINWVGFLVFVASMIGTPGPANMVMMAAGAAYGARRSLRLLAGVILGKQFIIWPLGLGIMGGLDATGPVFQLLKWASLAYIVWLAWKIAGSRIVARAAAEEPPGFLAGLIVHPLNPKAWAMIVGVFTNYVEPGSDPFIATFWACLGFVAIQLVAQPFWMLMGVQLSRLVSGTAAEVWLMRGLGLAVLGSVLWVIR